jgi:uncharacterized membrane protein
MGIRYRTPFVYGDRSAGILLQPNSIRRAMLPWPQGNWSRIPWPQLTEGRRAGLLAAVTVYPLSRLRGTLPHTNLDGALVSGATMAIAFQTAATATATLSQASAVGASSARARALRTVASCSVVAAGAGVIAWRTRATGRKLATVGDRLSIPRATAGAAAEVIAVAAGAGMVVELVDAIGMDLPVPLRPTHPAVVTVAVVIAGAALGVATRHPRLLRYLTLSCPDGDSPVPPGFQLDSNIPVAVARSAAVAGAAVAALALETYVAALLARLISHHTPAGKLAVVTGHTVIATGFAITGLVGFSSYSSRVAVREHLLEAAYAAIPSRSGVTGGSDSAYQFGELGREGRRFVSQAYTAEELVAVLVADASDPVRAWLPLNAVTSDAERDCAALVAEVERLGGFVKNTIVLAAPVGSGYVSYVQTESVELLTAGDCTTVAVPYAAVPSALALPRRERAATAYAAYARAIAARAQELNPTARVFTFGESLGSWVALDAFGPDLTQQLQALGFSGGLYCGVPIYSHTDKALRPRQPAVRERRGLQYATGRDQALTADPGFLNLSHPTDPVAVADTSTVVRHGVDYWGRPFGVHIPIVSFLVHLFDVKNAMNLRPGPFTPSPGHDYRYETAAGVARAYGLDFDQEEIIEAALRERELAWSVRRLLSRRLVDARDAAFLKLLAWGVDPATLMTRFHIPDGALPSWMDLSSTPAAEAAKDI